MFNCVMAQQFIHLRIHSSYSLSEGAIKVKDIADMATKNRMPAVAITDSCNLFGSLEFSTACLKAGVQPIIGSVIFIGNENAEIEGSIVALAKNNAGYKNLISLITNAFISNRSSKPYITLDELKQCAEGLIVLSGGPGGPIGKYAIAGNIEAAEKYAKSLKNIFPESFYIEIMRHGMEAEKKTEKAFLDIAYKENIPLVATNDVHFSESSMFEAAEVLLCIADGKYIADEDRRRLSPGHYFKTADEMVKLFADIPEAIENTVAIARRCSVMAYESAPMLPKFPTSNGNTEEQELLTASETGLKMRLEKEVFESGLSENEKEEKAKPYFDRLKFELDVITRMKFSGYFLIVSDFIRWSKSQGIPVGPGRGSGAGSVVAWALEITDLNPLRFGLLFERFLNPDRISMPDFDIDFCQERRDEVISYVREKYGRDRVAQIITFGKLQARAVLRDVGRVLQMPYTQVDKICKMVPFNPINPITLSQAIDLDPVLQKERDTDEQIAKLLDIGLKLEGLHRHASTHAAGVVISDKPLTDIVPLYADAKSDMHAIQYSMKSAESAGLVKFDFLGLKTLTVIENARKLVEKLENRKVDISIKYDDKKTYELLSKGDAVGVFQLESYGMRDALRKMKADKIEDIIALISLYRPGPMDNIPTYISRKHGTEKPDYLHPMLEGILKETFGVIIYQEQVMQIAQVLAGYTLGAADLLRRAMGKKNVAEMAAQREQFVSGAVAKGVDKNKAASIFDLVDKFAGYGFNKSHAAAYAIISYQTAYLKANWPVEFIVASMNLDINDTDKLNLFRQEAINHGIQILPPDINSSEAYFSVEVDAEGKKCIRYGLGALKNVGIYAMQLMQQERDLNGPFKNIFDFAARCDSKAVNKRQIESLAKAGALDSIHKNRRQVFESAHILTKYNAAATQERNTNQVSLFGDAENVAIPAPSLPDMPDWTREEKMHNDFEALGFYLYSHPIDVYVKDVEKMGVVSASRLAEIIPEGSRGKKVKLAGVVTATTHRASGKRRFTYLQFSDPTGVIEISLFDDRLISDSRDLIEGKAPLLITVDARKDEGGVRLVADSIVLLDEVLKNQQRSIKIFINKKECLPELKTLFINSGKGRTKISIVIETEQNMQVEMELLELHHINDNNFDHIRSIQGVWRVAES